MTVEKKRDFLDCFCDTHKDCYGCVLKFPVCRCGCSTHFLKRQNGKYDMTDAEIEEAYEIVTSNICFNGVDTADEKKADDPVNHPAHYTDGKIEVIDYIRDKKLGFCLGNAIKYISRAGKKDPTKTVQDLRKAIWYIERHIMEIEEVG